MPQGDGASFRRRPGPVGRREAATAKSSGSKSSAAARRAFCPTCGSYLFWEEHDGLVYISAGSLDGPTGLSMDGHIFYADRGDYYRVGERLPCWAAGRTGPEVAP
jgi:hypothetical protein